MFAFISTLVIIWLVMWGFYKFMYPKPPDHYFPKEGDIVTPRSCDFCGHDLAQYRGVLEKKSEGDGEWFFCNYEHQASFHAGEEYQPPSQP